MVALKTDREKEAAELFREASKGATVVMTAGVRELHMLANHSYKRVRGRNRPRQDQCTLLKLISKGILYYNDAGEPVLSVGGKLWRKILVVQGHIVGDTTRADLVRRVVQDEEPIEYFGPGYDL